MSIHYEGKCDNCGRENLRVTIDVHIHNTLGTLRHGGMVPKLPPTKGKGRSPPEEIQ
ncbi:MAG: hypothetical protein ACR2KF_02510 [Nitrososphaeraceae archaeon]